MDIPSIKFRYLEKLKLWHDYLSKQSVYEKEKKEYWKHEKMILHWAYSYRHKHLFTALSNRRILEAYGINKDNPGERVKSSELKEINTELDVDQLTSEVQEDIGKVNYFMGNLVVEELFDCIGIVKNKHGLELYPERIRVNKRGLLIGEILNEAYNKPTFRNKNFRKYKFGYILLIVIIILAGVSLIVVLLNQGLEFKEKIYNNIWQKQRVHNEHKFFLHKLHK